MRRFASVTLTSLLLVAASMCGGCGPAVVGDASAPLGQPVLEEPTLRSLGAYWIIRGDANKNARVEVAYRKAVAGDPAGDAQWNKSLPMLRVDKSATVQKTHAPQLAPAADQWLFAGSVVLLDPQTQYEIKLTLIDPDGGNAEHILKAATAGEPVESADAPKFYVAPGSGGGDGSDASPFLGLDAAQKAARPGDVFLVRKGTYAAPFAITKSGQAGKPIIYRAAGDGEAIIDGQGSSRGVTMRGVSHVWLEGLTIRGVQTGISTVDSSHLVIRGCHLHWMDMGIYCETSHDDVLVRSIYILDNVMEGPYDWGRDARGAGVEEKRGIQITGVGHVIAYNRIRNFKDGVDTFPSRYCSAIDIHNNDVSECMDDGIEMDFSERNTRCFLNRLTNCFQGISVQPVFGGPVYIFRNAMYNIKVETFKMHHNGGPKHPVDYAPSGCYMIHNTSVRQGGPLVLMTSASVHNSMYRNNLFVGSGGRRAYDNDAQMVDCDFDYDGFAGGPFEIFMKWNKVFYKTVEDVKANAPVYQNVVHVADVAGLFASGILPPVKVVEALPAEKNDLRLKAGTPAIDAGQKLDGFNDGFGGGAPDLGAYELGAELPKYGPRKK